MSKTTRPSSRTAAAGCWARYSSISRARRSGAICSLSALPGDRSETISSLPAHPCAQAGDVRRVMARVPVVERQCGRQVLDSAFGMDEFLLEIFFGHRFEQFHPAL